MAPAGRRHRAVPASRVRLEYPQPPGQRHFQMANLAGYPALNVPNGFTADGGTPTSIVFYAQPYREHQILALAKAYQDAAKWHLRTPAALDT